jgi:arsenite methyltransferase
LYLLPQTTHNTKEETKNMTNQPAVAWDSDVLLVSPEEAIRERYSRGAREVEHALCCPVTYDPKYLHVIPAEILERDYGCGDPTPYLRPGETVLDLGSGGGKVCYIAAQIVGPDGYVIGVDCNQEMLALARRHQALVAQRLGYANVDFRCGMIQDLRLDLDLLAAELARHPVRDQQGWLELRALEERLRRGHPLVADESVDCVISNCVLNLVRPEDRRQLFAEIFRVLKRGGRAVISDIVADEEMPEHLQRDPELWSGCISGAYREDAFLRAFEEAGFHGIEIAKRQKEPWRAVKGIEFRSLTVMAHKGKQGPCLERKQALIYRGPFKKVEDDDGHVFYRGERMAVCDKTFHLLQSEPYTGLFEPVEPLEEVPLADAVPFDCRHFARRDPRETKGLDYDATTEASSPCCTPGGACC